MRKESGRLPIGENRRDALSAPRRSVALRMFIQHGLCRGEFQETGIDSRADHFGLGGAEFTGNRVFAFVSQADGRTNVHADDGTCRDNGDVVPVESPCVI